MDRRPTILIVDDEPFNVDYLEQELEDIECETVSAENGREALDKVSAQAPDLILLDIMMPEMDGFQVLAHLKADEKLRDIPVIVVTAKAAPIDKVLWMNVAKVQDYVTKPFGPRELVESVERVLATYEPRKQ